MIDPDMYKEYIKTPYKAESASGEEIIFPAIDPKTYTPIRYDSGTVEKIKNTKILTADPRIQELKKIWPDADTSSWAIEDDNIRILKAPYKI
jgi:hypothetical protein